MFKILHAFPESTIQALACHKSPLRSGAHATFGVTFALLSQKVLCMPLLSLPLHWTYTVENCFTEKLISNAASPVKPSLINLTPPSMLSWMPSLWFLDCSYTTEHLLGFVLTPVNIVSICVPSSGSCQYLCLMSWWHIFER